MLVLKAIAYWSSTPLEKNDLSKRTITCVLLSGYYTQHTLHMPDLHRILKFIPKADILKLSLMSWTHDLLPIYPFCQSFNDQHAERSRKAYLKTNKSVNSFKPIYVYTCFINEKILAWPINVTSLHKKGLVLSMPILHEAIKTLATCQKEQGQQCLDRWSKDTNVG